MDASDGTDSSGTGACWPHLFQSPLQLAAGTLDGWFSPVADTAQNNLFPGEIQQLLNEFSLNKIIHELPVIQTVKAKMNEQTFKICISSLNSRITFYLVPFWSLLFQLTRL